MAAKMIPATIADKPAQRMSFEDVNFLLSFPSVAIFSFSSLDSSGHSACICSSVGRHRSFSFLNLLVDVGLVQLGGLTRDGRDQGQSQIPHFL